MSPCAAILPPSHGVVIFAFIVAPTKAWPQKPGHGLSTAPFAAMTMTGELSARTATTYARFRPAGANLMAWRIGIDIGGTFTDVALVQEDTGRIAIAKLATTPHDFGRAVIAGIRQ